MKLLNQDQIDSCIPISIDKKLSILVIHSFIGYLAFYPPFFPFPILFIILYKGLI